MTDSVLDGEKPAPVEHIEERRTFGDTPLRKFFEACVKFKASDLIMRGGQVPRLRLRGALKSIDAPPIDPVEFEKWVEEGLSEAHWAHYTEHGSLDIGFDLDEGARFRVNLFRTRGRSAIAARLVTGEILGFEALNLPASMQNIAELEQGLILLCGITGSGKSTSLAAMLEHINAKRQCHIVTIEDPIEYLFTDKKAIIHQREVGIDVPTFNYALRALVRENPDVVLIGEMRDRETFEAALRAAETGHLVFGTIHASSTSQAFSRIYDLFPETERELIRNVLAYQMQAFVYQKLLPTIVDEPARVPACEVLLQSPPTRKYILEGREHQLDEVISKNRDMGMQTFVDSLVDLVDRQLVHPRAAQAAAPSADEVKMRLRGIQNS